MILFKMFYFFLQFIATSIIYKPCICGQILQLLITNLNIKILNNNSIKMKIFPLSKIYSQDGSGVSTSYEQSAPL